MKKSIIYTALMICFAFLASSCDDSGITTEKNNIEFSATLKTLGATDGMYEAWVSIDNGTLDHGDAAYVSLGKFNISPAGALVDENGNVVKLNLNRVSNVNATEDAIITIEAPGDNDTLPGTRILGGAKVEQNGYLVFDMTMNSDEVFPVSGQFTQIPAAKYMLASPTDMYASFNLPHGVWFSQDTTGTIAGLQLPTIPDTAEWTYQAWVVDTRDSANRIYNMGRFMSSNVADDNSQCKGPNSVWNVPGHDWIIANCPGGGLPDIDNLNNSNYKLLITLEPRFENAGSPPFYINLFYGNLLITGAFGTTNTIPNTTVLPTAQIRLSVSR